MTEGKRQQHHLLTDHSFSVNGYAIACCNSDATVGQGAGGVFLQQAAGPGEQPQMNSDKRR
jgi:hypothetical protein